MTRSKLSWLHGLFGDDILITRQHFVFSEKHVICFSYKSHDFAHLCDFVTKFGYPVWSAWKYYSMCGIEYSLKTKISSRFLGLFYFCIVKRQSRTVLSSVLLFLCVTCDLTRGLGLWPVTSRVTCDPHFSPAVPKISPRRNSRDPVHRRHPKCLHWAVLLLLTALSAYNQTNWSVKVSTTPARIGKRRRQK